MSEKGMFASVRCYNVKNIQALASAREHAYRRDENSRERVDASRTHFNLVSSDYGDDGRDVVDCFKQFKAETGIKEQKSASVALHLLCIVSPEWLQETGDPRDPENPRVKELFRESQKWAEKAFGPGSVIASRLDVDEAGSGVVDVFVCPSSVVKQKNRDDRHVISTRKALKKVQREYKKPRSFMALQDSFAEYAQEHLDSRLQRGIPKSESQREHVHADIYRPAIQKAKQVREFAKSEAMQIRSEAEQEAKRIAEDAKKQGFQSGANDFANNDLISRVVMGSAIRAISLREEAKEEGRKEGKKETTKKANRAIETWKKNDKQQKEKIKNLTKERDELSQSLNDERNRSAEISEPLRNEKAKSEYFEILIQRKIERDLDEGNDPLPWLKEMHREIKFESGKGVAEYIAQFIEALIKMITGEEPEKNNVFSYKI